MGSQMLRYAQHDTTSFGRYSSLSAWGAHRRIIGRYIGGAPIMHIDELMRPSRAQSCPHLLFNLHNCAPTGYYRWCLVNFFIGAGHDQSAPMEGRMSWLNAMNMMAKQTRASARIEKNPEKMEVPKMIASSGTMLAIETVQPSPCPRMAALAIATHQTSLEKSCLG